MKDTAIGRLVTLLGGVSTNTSGADLMEVWAKTFGVAEPDAVVIAIADSKKILRDSIEWVKTTGRLNAREKHLALNALTAVGRQLQPSLVASSSGTGAVGRLSSEIDHHWLSLQLLVDRAAQDSTTEVIPQERLKDLESRISEVLSEIVEDTTLEPELRSFLNLQLSRLLTAIRNYRISGLQGLHEAFENVLGGVMLKHDVIQQAAEKNDPSWKKFSGLIAFFASTIGLTEKLNQIAEKAGIYKLLAEKIT